MTQRHRSTASAPGRWRRWYVNIRSVEWVTPPLRDRGEPSGFSRLVAPLMEAAMARANRADLARLKALLERAPAP